MSAITDVVHYRVVEEYEDEIIVITEDGGVACIRSAEPISSEDNRIATTDYYQSRITNDTNIDNVFEELGEGKAYYNDWDDTQCTSHDDPRLIRDAIEWLLGGEEEGVVYVHDTNLWRNIFK